MTMLRTILLLPTFAIALVACKTVPASEEQDVFPVDVPKPAAAHYERDYVGEVQAVRRAELRARIRGRIESVQVDEGQTVEAGQVLFSISSRDLRQELRRARAAVASATAELKAAELEQAQTKMLLEKYVVSPAELALVDAKIQSLAAKLEEARANEGQAAINLSYAEVRAPFDGVVNRIPKKLGSLVEEGELLTSIADPSEMFVYFPVSEQEYLEYRAAGEEGRREVSFRLANGELLPALGVTDAVESEIDRNTGTIAFRARFANEGRLLKHGSSGKLLVKSLVKDAVVVPQKSTFEVQDQVYVYVVDEEGRARARRIHLKLRFDDSFVVESGLQLGERFVAEGIQKVKDGERIAIRTDAPSATSAL